MKRTGNLFNEIASIDNLRIAFRKASKGKHNRASVQKIEKDLENKLQELRALLIDGKFHTSKYRTKKIYEPKERLIYILPFWPDRVVQHAIMNVLEPIWEGLFIKDSYSCMKGRGQHSGSKRCMQFVKHYKYVGKSDIYHFYLSLHHKILKRIIRRKLKDKKALTLIDDIIDSIPGDTNIAIGNSISQWFGNLYLNELDMFVKHKLHCKAYIRYCDDFLLFSNSKEQLKEWKMEINEFVENQLMLSFSKSEIFPTSRGVDFLGYRHFPDGYLLVRKSTAKRIKRNISKVRTGIKNKTINPVYARGAVESAYGWASWANSYNFMQSLGLDILRKEVAEYAKLFGIN